MADLYANEFREILSVLAQNDMLWTRVIALIETEPMPGKVTEGAERLARFRGIMDRLVRGQLSLIEAYSQVETDLPRSSSRYGHNNKVFAANWSERLVRTQLSRSYNQVVMEFLQITGHARVFVPHSSEEDSTTSCSRQLAGRSHELGMLYDRLIKAYRLGIWDTGVKIPDHPHCTHVVRPDD
jgi:hypothetical protein